MKPVPDSADAKTPEWKDSFAVTPVQLDALYAQAVRAGAVNAGVCD